MKPLSRIQHADVLVLAESNRPFKISEYQALEQFVAAGKGIYLWMITITPIASKAKGLVYLSAQDNATAWNHAIDSGLYFGGRDEGPYVAIAKSGLGKAAFIGDSSPVEDATPKYRRQDSGSTKRTYPGWTDPGDAATLSVNIINWLATPESYTAFDYSGLIIL